MREQRRSGTRYVPSRGDVVWWDFDAQAGHEQSGRRPAVVITPRHYNVRSGLAIFCSVTSKSKGYPFDVIIPNGLPVSGAIQADQIRSADWQARRVARICVLPEAVMDEVLGKLQALVGRG